MDDATRAHAHAIADEIAREVFAWFVHHGVLEASASPLNLDLDPVSLVPTIKWYSVICSIAVAFGSAYNISSVVAEPLLQHLEATAETWTIRSRAHAIADWIDRVVFRWLVRHGVIDATAPQRPLELASTELLPTVDWLTVVLTVLTTYGITRPLLVKGLEKHLQATAAATPPLFSPAVVMGDAARATIDWLTDAVFTWLAAAHVIDDDRSTKTDLGIQATEIRPNVDWDAVRDRILTAYGLSEPTVLDGMIDHLEATAEELSETSLISMHVQAGDLQQHDGTKQASIARDHYEFTRPFVGGGLLVTHLMTYITRCVHAVTFDNKQYAFPYVSIVQSSGFGKSRVLRELADVTRKNEQADRMRMLYVCLRPAAQSGYPRGTHHVRSCLFPHAETRAPAWGYNRVENLTTRLCRLYDYAYAHWDTVGTEWVSLFDHRVSDKPIRQRLLEHMDTDRTNVRPLTSSRTVILAIDEAQYLQNKDTQSIDWFPRLEHALQKALCRIRAKYGRHAVLFAVLVGTARHESRRDPDGETVLFPSFVLTHTMDVRFKLSIERAKRNGVSSTRFYQELVNRPYDEAWPVLVAMGRPLWDRVKLRNEAEPEEPTNVIQFAADKLLGGRSAKDKSNLNDASIGGVASVLCRAGLRPHSWAPFTSRVVADGMAVLLYTTFSQTQRLSSYSSDPILTFGAARVWYQSATDSSNEQATLATVILPHLRKLLRQEVIDMGTMGEVVSRLLLLLAMDATGAVRSQATNASEARQYAGEFYSGKAFLTVLYGSRHAREQLRWRVGFSHFVQAAREPDDAMLWAMLARRAAGIFPRNVQGVDLFIPIFKGSEVSMMMVHVTTHAATKDPSFPESASIAMRPSVVFTNQFQRLAPTKVVRIYMNLRGPNAAERHQFYLVDDPRRYNSGATTAAEDKESYVLCLEGLGPWRANRVGAGHAAVDLVPVVSNGVAEELRLLLLEPSGDITALVEEDIDHRNALGRVRVDEAAVRSTVSRPSVASLLSTWPDGANAATEQETVANGESPQGQ